VTVRAPGATTPAKAAFALLVVAAFGAFFAAQRIKQSPRQVKTLSVSPVFSPALGYRKAGIRLRIEKRDDITVSLLNGDGDVVRRLLENHPEPPKRPIQLYWDGKDSAGHRVPDGEYRVRVSLRHAGRAVVLLDSIRTDSTKPRPAVVILGAPNAGPTIFPLHGAQPVRFRVTNAPVVNLHLALYRTDPDGHPTRQDNSGLTISPDRQGGEWNGRIRGRLAPPGTYVIVARVNDRAANIGASYPYDPAPGKPIGRAGVTVRYLAAQAPSGVVRAGSSTTVFVDARGKAYLWRLRPLDVNRTIAKGKSSRPAIHIALPASLRSGVYALDLLAGGRKSFGGQRRARVLVAVQGRTSAPLLVVLPVTTWQGFNPIDDDGDGLPDTLPRGGLARIDRPYAGAGIPPGFTGQIGPLLALFSKPAPAVKFDLTTDIELASRPKLLSTHKGVVLIGDSAWLPDPLGDQLRSWVEGGGKVVSFGTGSLRRSVTVAKGSLSRPTHASAFDIFGSAISPLRGGSVELLAGDDAIQLFHGTDGSFQNFETREETVDPGRDAKVVSLAATADGRPVIVAVQLKKGLVIRTGLPQWADRARSGDANVQALTRQALALVSQ
jgi:hypothetical protein